MLLFTDGLIEAPAPGIRHGAGDRLYGELRARDALRDLVSADPKIIVESLQREAQSFAGGALADDLCLLAARASDDPAH